ncbi:MAG: hypothetical protein ABMA01_12760 [Chthoniobacteraceae bacterium]
MTAMPIPVPFRRLSKALCVPLAFAAAFTASADPLSELASFSAVKDVNLEKLAGGSVQMGRGAAMGFPRGLAVESVYVVRKPLQATVESHQRWNPARHSGLKVYLHTDIPSRPGPGDFQKLDSAPSNRAVKSLVAATQKLASGGTDLQLSNAERSAFSAQGDGGGGAMPANVSAFWRNVLLQRSQAFLSGGAGRLAPYETGKESIRAADEIARLLKEAGKIRGQFAGLIGANPLTGGRGSLSPSPYWELVDVEGQAAVSLGVSYSKSGAGSWQMLDGQYYSSGGYYVLLTFQQFWPVQIGGQEATLVWRGDLLSAASLANLHGVERMGSSSAFMRETRRNVEALLKDAGRK